MFDADLKGYFDTIPHDKLMKALEMRISDRSVLRLIRLWLRAPMEDLHTPMAGTGGPGGPRHRKRPEGTPQGGVISPLLANVYLHWLDKLFMARDGPGHWAGARIVRYADDFQIFARRQQLGGWAPAITSWVSDLVEGRMGLTLNGDKTKIVQVRPQGEPLDFLGYRARWEKSWWSPDRFWASLKPSPRSQQRFRDRVVELTGSNRGYVPVDELVPQVNRYLAGWGQSFCTFHRGRTVNKADGYVFARLVHHLKRRSQRGVRPSHGLGWYQFLYTRLGTRRLAQLCPSKADR